MRESTASNVDNTQGHVAEFLRGAPLMLLPMVKTHGKAHVTRLLERKGLTVKAVLRACARYAVLPAIAVVLTAAIVGVGLKIVTDSTVLAVIVPVFMLLFVAAGLGILALEVKHLVGKAIRKTSAVVTAAVTPPQPDPTPAAAPAPVSVTKAPPTKAAPPAAQRTPAPAKKAAVPAAAPAVVNDAPAPAASVPPKFALPTPAGAGTVTPRRDRPRRPAASADTDK